MKKIFFLIALSAICISFGYAQEADTEPQTLSEKFYYLKQKSNRWEDYKVVRETSLNAFWNNVQDSVNLLKADLTEANLKIRAQQMTLNEQKKAIEEVQAKLDESLYRNSRISFLGFYIQQSAYASIVWGIIAALALTLMIGYWRFRQNEKTTRKKIKDFNELSGEFEEYRKIVRQREIRIKRELQTANNKLEEIKHRPATTR